MATWKVATILPTNRMCSTHRALYEGLTVGEKATRERYVGKKMKVLDDNEPIYWAPKTHGVGDSIPTGDCRPLRARQANGCDGYDIGVFSCEVEIEGESHLEERDERP